MPPSPTGDSIAKRPSTTTPAGRLCVIRDFRWLRFSHIGGGVLKETGGAQAGRLTGATPMGDHPNEVLMKEPVRIVGSYLSPYVRKVLVVLDQKGIPYEIDPIV